MMQMGPLKCKTHYKSGYCQQKNETRMKVIEVIPNDYPITEHSEHVFPLHDTATQCYTGHNGIVVLGLAGDRGVFF